MYTRTSVSAPLKKVLSSDFIIHGSKELEKRTIKIISCQVQKRIESSVLAVF